MNLVKKLFRRASGDHNGRTALVQNHGGWPKRSHTNAEFGLGRNTDRLWRDLDRDPWSAIRDPWSVMDRMTQGLGGIGNWPALDVSKDDTAVTVRCDVPGLAEEDLDVRVSGRLLTIRGHREDEWQDLKSGVRRHERVSGSFVRTVTLPEHVDPSRVEATYRNGTLTITAPWMPGRGPKRVRVAAA